MLQYFRLKVYFDPVMELFSTENTKIFQNNLHDNKVDLEIVLNSQNNPQRSQFPINLAYDREFLQSLSRADLEQLLISKIPQPSNSSIFNHFSLTDQTTQHSATIKSQQYEEKSEKINSSTKFTSDPSLLPNSSSYILNTKQSSEKDNAITTATNNSDYFTVGNLPKASPKSDLENENKRSDQNDSNSPITSLGGSLNNIVNRLSVQSHQLGIERFRRSVSPIFKKYEILEKEKENMHNINFKNPVTQNESFGVPHQSVQKESKCSSTALQGSGITSSKTLKKETSSAAIAGAMRALQEKLRALEEENHQLKNALNANDGKGDSGFVDNTKKCRGMSGIELLENAKKQCSENEFRKENKKKNEELDSQSKKLESSKRELEDQLQKERITRETTEKKLKEKVKQLEVSLKEALEQIHFYKQELEIITEYCGRENNSLNDALSAIRAKYRANIEQFQVQLQTLNQERKKLKKIATTQAEENRQLRTKIELLEKAHLNNSQGIQPNEEILEQLQQINQELFSKSQKTSDFRVDSNLFQSLKLTNPESPTTLCKELKTSSMLKSSHKRSLSDLSDKLRGRSGSKSSKRSNSEVKERLSTTLTKSFNNGDSQTKRSFSQSLSSSLIVKKKSSKKEGKSGKKNSSAKLKTPKKSDKKEKKNKLSHSLRNVESQGSLKKNKSLKNFNETSPYKNSKKVLGYSARTLNQVLGENRKPLSIHGTLICNVFNCKTELECSPRFSNAPSPMKPKLLEKKI